MPHGTAFWFVLVVRASAAETLYDLLGVKASANSRDIKKAWHLSALRLHPDKVEGGPADKSAAAERFKMLAEAYEVLSDAALRQQYDRTGQVPTDKEKASASSKKSTSAEDDEFGFEGGSQQQRQPNSWFQRYGGGFDAFEVGLAQGRARRVRSLEGLRRLLQPAAGERRWGLVGFYRRGEEGRLKQGLRFPYPFAGWSVGSQGSGFWWEDAIQTCLVSIGELAANTETGGLLAHYLLA